ncbi:MAG: ABC transporter substrate-binding protein [Anaerolineae bacterium]
MHARTLSRRELLRFSGLAVAGAALAACGAATAQPAAQQAATAAPTVVQQAATAAPAPAEKVALNIAGWFDKGTQATVEKQIELFNQDFPDISVSVIVIPFDPQKTVVMLASGAGPDVFWVNNDQVSFWSERGAVFQLDDMMQRDGIDKLDFIEPVQQQIYTYKGHTYSITESVAGMHLIVNPLLFEAAGVELPPHDFTDPSWTVDSLLEKATALTKRSGDGPAEQYGLYVSTGWWGNGSFLWSFGGEFMDDTENPTKVTFDSPEMREGLTWVSDLRLKHGVVSTVADEQTLPFSSQFTSGKLAMAVTGAWMWPYFSDPEIKTRVPWEIYPLPRATKGQYCQLAGNSYSIAARTKYPDQAWELLKHVTVGEGAKTFLAEPTCKGLPSTWTLANDPKFLSWFDEGSKKTAMETHKMGHWFPKHPNWIEMAFRTTQVVQELWVGNLTVEEAATGAQTAMETVLTESS